jgi:hypothetical protein
MGAGLGALMVAFTLAAGCGPERPPVSGGSGPIARGSSGPQFDVDAGIMPPGCGTTPEGAECECLDIPLFVDPPNLYFVLDRSGSMANPDKWNQVRVTVGKIMRGLGPRANFGAAMFPANNAPECAPGDEIMSVRPGDPPSSGVDGPTTTALLTATRVLPGGGTPTGATLALVKNRLSTVPGKTFVILATDGAPNCNPSAGCGFDRCQLNIENVQGCPKEGPFNCCEPPQGYAENCNDTTATVQAINALRTSGVPVYVIGLPGAGPYASLLDEMAVVGGTARSTSPKYFAVNAANEDSVLAALKQIAAQIAGTCTFDLKEEPANPEQVNVYMDDVVLPFEPVNGWTLSGKSVTLVGAACDRVKSGDVLSVRVIAGCPRIGPK